MFITKEIEVGPFKAGILISEADLLSPVVVHAEKTHQRPWDVDEQITKALSAWAAYAGPAGIGQFSLGNNQNIIALGRVNTYFRKPLEEEIKEDIDTLGEQVLDESKPEDEGKAYIITKGWMKGLKYTGPERLVKTVILTRVKRAQPYDISDLLTDVDRDSEKGEMIVTQGYHLLSAQKGTIFYTAFMEREKYDRNKLELFGQVEIKDKKMIWLPKGDKKNPIDYTPELRLFNYA